MEANNSASSNSVRQSLQIAELSKKQAELVARIQARQSKAAKQLWDLQDSRNYKQRVAVHKYQADADILLQQRRQLGYWTRMTGTRSDPFQESFKDNCRELKVWLAAVQELRGVLESDPAASELEIGRVDGGFERSTVESARRLAYLMAAYSLSHHLEDAIIQWRHELESYREQHRRLFAQKRRMEAVLSSLGAAARVSFEKDLEEQEARLHQQDRRVQAARRDAASLQRSSSAWLDSEWRDTSHLPPPHPSLGFLPDECSAAEALDWIDKATAMGDREAFPIKPANLDALVTHQVPSTTASGAASGGIESQQHAASVTGGSAYAGASALESRDYPSRREGSSDRGQVLQQRPGSGHAKRRLTPQIDSLRDVAPRPAYSPLPLVSPFSADAYEGRRSAASFQHGLAGGIVTGDPIGFVQESQAFTPSTPATITPNAFRRQFGTFGTQLPEYLHAGTSYSRESRLPGALGTRRRAWDPVAGYQLDPDPDGISPHRQDQSRPRTEPSRSRRSGRADEVETKVEAVRSPLGPVRHPLADSMGSLPAAQRADSILGIRNTPRHAGNSLPRVRGFGKPPPEGKAEMRKRQRDDAARTRRKEKQELSNWREVLLGDDGRTPAEIAAATRRELFNEEVEEEEDEVGVQSDQKAPAGEFGRSTLGTTLRHCTRDASAVIQMQLDKQYSRLMQESINGTATAEMRMLALARERKEEHDFTREREAKRLAVQGRASSTRGSEQASRPGVSGTLDSSRASELHVTQQKYEMPRDLVEAAGSAAREFASAVGDFAALKARPQVNGTRPPSLPHGSPYRGNTGMNDPLFAVTRTSNPSLPRVDPEFAAGIPKDGSKRTSTLTRTFFKSESEVAAALSSRLKQQASLETRVLRAMVKRQLIVQQLRSACADVKQWYEEAMSVGAEASVTTIRAEMTRYQAVRQSMDDSQDVTLMPDHLTDAAVNPYTRAQQASQQPVDAQSHADDTANHDQVADSILEGVGVDPSRSHDDFFHGQSAAREAMRLCATKILPLFGAYRSATVQLVESVLAWQSHEKQRMNEARSRRIRLLERIAAESQAANSNRRVPGGQSPDAVKRYTVRLLVRGNRLWKASPAYKPVMGKRGYRAETGPFYSSDIVYVGTFDSEAAALKAYSAATDTVTAERGLPPTSVGPPQLIQRTYPSGGGGGGDSSIGGADVMAMGGKSPEPSTSTKARVGPDGRMILDFDLQTQGMQNVEEGRLGIVPGPSGEGASSSRQQALMQGGSITSVPTLAARSMAKSGDSSLRPIFKVGGVSLLAEIARAEDLGFLRHCDPLRVLTGSTFRFRRNPLLLHPMLLAAMQRTRGDRKGLASAIVEAMAGAVEAHEQRLSLIPQAILDFDDVPQGDGSEGLSADVLHEAEGSGVWNPVGIPAAMVRVHRQKQAIKVGEMYVSQYSADAGISSRVGVQGAPMRDGSLPRNPLDQDKNDSRGLSFQVLDMGRVTTAFETLLVEETDSAALGRDLRAKADSTALRAAMEVGKPYGTAVGSSSVGRSGTLGTVAEEEFSVSGSDADSSEPQGDIDESDTEGLGSGASSFDAEDERKNRVPRKIPTSQLRARPKPRRRKRLGAHVVDLITEMEDSQLDHHKSSTDPEQLRSSRRTGRRNSIAYAYAQFKTRAQRNRFARMGRRRSSVVSQFADEQQVQRAMLEARSLYEAEVQERQDRIARRHATVLQNAFSGNAYLRKLSQTLNQSLGRRQAAAHGEPSHDAVDAPTTALSTSTSLELPDSGIAERHDARVAAEREAQREEEARKKALVNPFRRWTKGHGTGYEAFGGLPEDSDTPQTDSSAVTAADEAQSDSSYDPVLDMLPEVQQALGVHYKPGEQPRGRQASSLLVTEDSERDRTSVSRTDYPPGDVSVDLHAAAELGLSADAAGRIAAKVHAEKAASSLELDRQRVLAGRRDARRQQRLLRNTRQDWRREKRLRWTRHRKEIEFERARAKKHKEMQAAVMALKSSGRSIYKADVNEVDPDATSSESDDDVDGLMKTRVVGAIDGAKTSKVATKSDLPLVVQVQGAGSTMMVSIPSHSSSGASNAADVFGDPLSKPGAFSTGHGKTDMRQHGRHSMRYEHGVHVNKRARIIRDEKEHLLRAVVRAARYFRTKRISRIIKRLHVLERRTRDPKVPERIRWAEAEKSYIFAARKAAPEAQRLIRGFLARQRVRNIKTVNGVAKLRGTYVPNRRVLAVHAAAEFRKEVIESAIERFTQQSRPRHAWSHTMSRCYSPIVNLGGSIAGSASSALRALNVPRKTAFFTRRTTSRSAARVHEVTSLRVRLYALEDLWNCCLVSTVGGPPAAAAVLAMLVDPRSASIDQRLLREAKLEARSFDQALALLQLGSPGHEMMQLSSASLCETETGVAPSLRVTQTQIDSVMMSPGGGKRRPKALLGYLRTEMLRRGVTVSRGGSLVPVVLAGYSALTAAENAGYSERSDVISAYMRTSDREDISYNEVPLEVSPRSVSSSEGGPEFDLIARSREGPAAEQGGQRPPTGLDVALARHDALLSSKRSQLALPSVSAMQRKHFLASMKRRSSVDTSGTKRLSKGADDASRRYHNASTGTGHKSAPHHRRASIAAAGAQQEVHKSGRVPVGLLLPRPVTDAPDRLLLVARFHGGTCTARVLETEEYVRAATSSAHGTGLDLESTRARIEGFLSGQAACDPPVIEAVIAHRFSGRSCGYEHILVPLESAPDAGTSLEFKPFAELAKAKQLAELARTGAQSTAALSNSARAEHSQAVSALRTVEATCEAANQYFAAAHSRWIQAVVRLAAADAAARDQLGYSKKIASEWRAPPAVDERQSHDPKEDARGQLTLLTKRRLAVALQDFKQQRNDKHAAYLVAKSAATAARQDYEVFRARSERLQLASKLKEKDAFLKDRVLSVAQAVHDTVRTRVCDRALVRWKLRCTQKPGGTGTALPRDFTPSQVPVLPRQNSVFRQLQDLDSGGATGDTESALHCPPPCALLPMLMMRETDAGCTSAWHEMAAESDNSGATWTAFLYPRQEEPLPVPGPPDGSSQQSYQLRFKDIPLHGRYLYRFREDVLRLLWLLGPYQIVCSASVGGSVVTLRALDVALLLAKHSSATWFGQLNPMFEPRLRATVLSCRKQLAETHRRFAGGTSVEGREDASVRCLHTVCMTLLQVLTGSYRNRVRCSNAMPHVQCARRQLLSQVLSGCARFASSRQSRWSLPFRSVNGLDSMACVVWPDAGIELPTSVVFMGAHSPSGPVPVTGSAHAGMHECQFDGASGFVALQKAALTPVCARHNHLFQLDSWVQVSWEVGDGSRFAVDVPFADVQKALAVGLGEIAAYEAGKQLQNLSIQQDLVSWLLQRLVFVVSRDGTIERLAVWTNPADTPCLVLTTRQAQIELPAVCCVSPTSSESTCVTCEMSFERVVCNATVLCGALGWYKVDLTMRLLANGSDVEASCSNLGQLPNVHVSINAVLDKKFMERVSEYAIQELSRSRIGLVHAPPHVGRLIDGQAEGGDVGVSALFVVHDIPPHSYDAASVLYSDQNLMQVAGRGASARSTASIDEVELKLSFDRGTHIITLPLSDAVRIGQGASVLLQNAQEDVAYAGMLVLSKTAVGAAGVAASGMEEAKVKMKQYHSSGLTIGSGRSTSSMPAKLVVQPFHSLTPYAAWPAWSGFVSLRSSPLSLMPGSSRAGLLLSWVQIAQSPRSGELVVFAWPAVEATRIARDFCSGIRECTHQLYKELEAVEATEAAILLRSLATTVGKAYVAARGAAWASHSRYQAQLRYIARENAQFREERTCAQLEESPYLVENSRPRRHFCEAKLRGTASRSQKYLAHGTHGSLEHHEDLRDKDLLRPVLRDGPLSDPFVANACGIARTAIVRGAVSNQEKKGAGSPTPAVEWKSAALNRGMWARFAAQKSELKHRIVCAESVLGIRPTLQHAMVDSLAGEVLCPSSHVLAQHSPAPIVELEATRSASLLLDQIRACPSPVCAVLDSDGDDLRNGMLSNDSGRVQQELQRLVSFSTAQTESNESATSANPRPVLARPVVLSTSATEDILIDSVRCLREDAERSHMPRSPSEIVLAADIHLSALTGCSRDIAVSDTEDCAGGGIAIVARTFAAADAMHMLSTGSCIGVDRSVSIGGRLCYAAVSKQHGSAGLGIGANSYRAVPNFRSQDQAQTCSSVYPNDQSQQWLGLADFGRDGYDDEGGVGISPTSLESFLSFALLGTPTGRLVQEVSIRAYHPVDPPAAVQRCPLVTTRAHNVLPAKPTSGTVEIISMLAEERDSISQRQQLTQAVPSDLVGRVQTAFLEIGAWTAVGEYQAWSNRPPRRKRRLRDPPEVELHMLPVSSQSIQALLYELGVIISSEQATGMVLQMRRAGFLKLQGNDLEGLCLRSAPLAEEEASGAASGASASRGRIGRLRLTTGLRRLLVTDEGKQSPAAGEALAAYRALEAEYRQVSAGGTAAALPDHPGVAEWISPFHFAQWYSMEHAEAGGRPPGAGGVSGAMLGVSMAIAKAFRGKARKAREIS